MSLSIPTKDIKHLLGEIIGKWPTYGPVADKLSVGTRFRFAKLEAANDYVMHYGPTVVPPKKYLFPAKEDIFHFERGEILPPSNKEFVLFGVNKRDGEGLFYLDKVMGSPVADGHYADKRANMRLVIVDSLAPSSSVVCDLYLQIVDEKHLEAFPFTEFGEQLVQGNKYFGHADGVGALSNRHMPDDIVFHPNLDTIIENSKDHPVWKRLTETCFTCGVCSYVCPLCYCYDQKDKIKITANIATDVAGSRERSWDSCMLPDFAAVSFDNFRPDVKERIYNWYYHKFVRMPREYGFPGCIDCGRCIMLCPAGINYREVLKELIENDKHRK